MFGVCHTHVSATVKESIPRPLGTSSAGAGGWTLWTSLYQDTCRSGQVCPVLCVLVGRTGVFSLWLANCKMVSFSNSSLHCSHALWCAATAGTQSKATQGWTTVQKEDYLRKNSFIMEGIYTWKGACLDATFVSNMMLKMAILEKFFPSFIGRKCCCNTSFFTRISCSHVSYSKQSLCILSIKVVKGLYLVLQNIIQVSLKMWRWVLWLYASLVSAA